MDCDDDDDSLASFEGLTTAQLLDVFNGEPPHEPVERQRKRSAARKLIGLKITCWPPFDVLWDLSEGAQRFSLDGVSSRDFQKTYPDGLRLGWVSMDGLDQKLSQLNVRTPEEVWDVGDNLKAAMVLLEWIEGRAISPLDGLRAF